MPPIVLDNLLIGYKQTDWQAKYIYSSEVSALINSIIIYISKAFKFQTKQNSHAEWTHPYSDFQNSDHFCIIPSGYLSVNMQYTYQKGDICPKNMTSY